MENKYILLADIRPKGQRIFSEKYQKLIDYHSSIYNILLQPPSTKWVEFFKKEERCFWEKFFINEAKPLCSCPTKILMQSGCGCGGR